MDPRRPRGDDGRLGGCALTEQGSGIALSAGQIGLAAAIYVSGACLGALFFGQLTDRFGRKKLFLLTLLVYIVATVATAFAFAPWYFYIARFFTGAGIGGEYAAINSAIDELIPARVRGQVDLVINGSYWLGAAGGAAAAVFFLNEAIFAADVGWRVAFGAGALLGLAILVVRRHVPASPRWLFIHGREEEAERIVESIERDVREETGQELPEPEDTLRVRQRERIPFRTIASTAFRLYPKRAVLGLALFVGQAFIYNGITFNLGTLLSGFFGVASGVVPMFIVVYALGNFAGPVLLGRLFDTVGRVPMISMAYLGSAVLTVPLAVLFLNGALTAWTFMAFVVGIFFLASAGASAAYLTVSEIFPMETRALAIAFFYAVGTAVGGISGPLLFGTLIDSGRVGYVTTGFLIAAGVMAIGGLAEIFLGVRAEKANLEDLAKPLTAEDAADEEDEAQEEPQAAATTGSQGRESTEAQRLRAEAEQVRARAAEHRARALELAAEDENGDRAAGDRRRAEEVLAEAAELRGRALDEDASAQLHREEAAARAEGAESAEWRARAEAAELRATGLREQEQALTADGDGSGRWHESQSEAAYERARALEQRALAQQARAESDGSDQVKQARAEMHEAWAGMHEQRAQMHEAAADGSSDARDAAEQAAGRAEQAALAAEERVHAAEHRVDAEGLQADEERTERQRADADEAERQAAALEERIRRRIERRQAMERRGLRRWRPGPGSVLSSGRIGSVDSRRAAGVERALDHEVDVVARALAEHGPTERHELARMVSARYWGPGRFGAALRVALEEGRVRRLSRSTYGPGEG